MALKWEKIMKFYINNQINYVKELKSLTSLFTEHFF